MKTIKQLQTDLNLNQKQAEGVSRFINELVVEMLNSLKEDTISNFEETIEALKQIG